MPAPRNYEVQLTEAERRRQIISLKQAAEIKNLSEDSFRRHYGHLIVRTGPRRVGVRLGDVLA
jgi:hypothetical protein